MKKLEIATFVLAIIGIICGIVGYCTEVQWATDIAWMMLGAGATTFTLQAWPTHKGNGQFPFSPRKKCMLYYERMKRASTE